MTLAKITPLRSFGLLGAVAVVVLGCAAAASAPEVRLYKESASYHDFSRDRRACIGQAQQHLSGRYSDAAYGFSATHTMPSARFYYECMSAHGYRQVKSGGFVPETTEQMIP